MGSLIVYFTQGFQNNNTKVINSLVNYFVCLIRLCCKEENQFVETLIYPSNKKIKPELQLPFPEVGFESSDYLKEEFDHFFESKEDNIFRKSPDTKKLGQLDSFSIPKVNIPLEKFFELRFKILEGFHYLYQEMKLNDTFFKMRRRLCYFLFCYSKNLDQPSARIFVDYYIQEFPDIVTEYINDEDLQKIEQNVEIAKSFSEKDSKINEPECIDIFTIMIKCYEKSSPPRNKFSLFFRNSQCIGKIFESLSDSGKNSFFCLNKEGFSQIENEVKLIYSLQSRKEKLFPLANRNSFSIDASKNSPFENELREFKPNSKLESILCQLYKRYLKIENFSILPIPIKIILIDYLSSNFSTISNSKLPVPILKFIYSLLDRRDYNSNLPIENTKSKYSLGYDLPKIISRIVQNSNEECQVQNSENERRKNDLVFQEAFRLLDSVSTIKIKINRSMNIPEDRFQTEGLLILNKLGIRRMSLLVGQGAFNFGSVNTYITETLTVPKIIFTGLIVPADLRISLDLKDEKDAGILQWPEFHNGVSTGLKLSQALKNQSSSHLRTWIFYQKPESPKNEHAGLLLAFGLLGFLDSFTPPDIYFYMKEIHEVTTVGMLLGLSASRIGKYDESTFKTLCIHIPSLLPKSFDLDIATPIQTAALTGIGLLYMGSGQKLMTEMTLSQIGMKPFSDKSPDRDSFSLAAGFSLGMINLGKGGKNSNLSELNLDERLIRYIEGGKPMPPPQSVLSTHVNVENKSSTIKEGSNVNTHLTAPPALMALTLMYLKSNNKIISSKISIPNTLAMLENTNPNLILLKILARNLIMWDQIDCTSEFVYSQIPEFIRFIYERPINDILDKFLFTSNAEDIDFNTVASVYFNIIGGCLLSIGLKFAGTGNIKAMDTILREIQKIRKVKVNTCELANDSSMKNSIPLYTINHLISVSLLSLSLVMAGTCNVNCLKMARIIRKKFQSESQMHFGFNMAVHMATGFLFLGNGKYTFSKSNFAIGALLISVYPQFPQSPGDNKYHLQALRHFYVLAIEERVFHSIDVNTKQSVNVNVELMIKQNDEIFKEKTMTPILIQDSKKITVLKVKDEEYYDLELNENLPNSQNLYVQKKVIKDSDLPLLKEMIVMKNFNKKELKAILNKNCKYRHLISLINFNDIDSKDLNEIECESYLMKENPIINFELIYLALLEDKQEYIELAIYIESLKDGVC